jgi:hypothetical protein
VGRVVFAIALALVVCGAFAPAGAQSPDVPTDVCKLLTVKEAAKTLGQPVGEGTPSTRELTGSQGTQDTCTWETQQADTGILSGTRLQLVASLQSKCADPDPKACFTADKRVARGKHEEKDLKKTGGHEAFYVYAGEVEVLVGSRILSIQFNNFNTNMFSRKSFERRFAKVMNLETLILTGSGRERTSPEYRALFRGAGFAVHREIPLPSLFTVFDLTAG